jgi:hypothetical protein
VAGFAVPLIAYASKRYAQGYRYIGAIRTSGIGYTRRGIIDNLLIEGVNSAAVNFVNPIYLVSILNG